MKIFWQAYSVKSLIKTARSANPIGATRDKSMKSTNENLNLWDHLTELATELADLAKPRQYFSHFFGALAAVLLANLWLSGSATAHVSASHVNGFWAGVAHPIGGLDHILAMVAVGLWAAQLGKKALWAVPLSFVAVMTGGAWLGTMQLNLPFVEQGILASDFILGLVILCAVRLPLMVSASLVGILAVFHGYAHGAEMPATASGLAYGAGFLVSTVALHLSGLVVGLGLKAMTVKLSAKVQDWALRCGGVAILGGASWQLYTTMTQVSP